MVDSLPRDHPALTYGDPCIYCDEPLLGNVAAGVIHTEEGPRYGHRECALREVLGGIGHHVAHEYWCKQHHDPDAGLTRRQSARLVAAWVEIMGLNEAVERSQM